MRDLNQIQKAILLVLGGAIVLAVAFLLAGGAGDSAAVETATPIEVVVPSGNDTADEDEPAAAGTPEAETAEVEPVTPPATDRPDKDAEPAATPVPPPPTPVPPTPTPVPPTPTPVPPTPTPVPPTPTPIPNSDPVLANLAVSSDGMVVTIAGTATDADNDPLEYQIRIKDAVTQEVLAETQGQAGPGQILDLGTTETLDLRNTATLGVVVEVIVNDGQGGQAAAQRDLLVEKVTTVTLSQVRLILTSPEECFSGNARAITLDALFVAGGSAGVVAENPQTELREDKTVLILAESMAQEHTGAFDLEVKISFAARIDGDKAYNFYDASGIHTVEGGQSLVVDGHDTGCDGEIQYWISVTER